MVRDVVVIVKQRHVGQAVRLDPPPQPHLLERRSQLPMQSQQPDNTVATLQNVWTIAGSPTEARRTIEQHIERRHHHSCRRLDRRRHHTLRKPFVTTQVMQRDMQTRRRKHRAPQCVYVAQMPRQHGDPLSNARVRKDRQEQPVRRARQRLKTHESTLLSMTTHARNYRINPNRRTSHITPRPSPDGYVRPADA